MSFFGLNNPIPRDLSSEAKKAANVLRSFVKPNQVLSQDQVIPPAVLKKAKGLAVITVLKAGFLFSGRAGSGVIIARSENGDWSPPSAIAMAGAGAGGLVGVELTDFVFILNSEEAVKSFSEFGTITLGGNVSVSAGPLGRNAEADASASTGGLATVFSYSKSKGLFAGISVEGSAIIERRETNRKMYGDNCTTKLILSGAVSPPKEFDPLYKVLTSRAFNRDFMDNNNSSFYDDIPDTFSSDSFGDRSRGSRNSSDYHSRDHYERDQHDSKGYCGDYEHRERGAPHGRGSHERDVDDGRHEHRAYDSHERETDRRFNSDSVDGSSTREEDSNYRLNSVANHNRSASVPSKVIARFDFVGVEKDDLPFSKGDVIEVLRKTGTQNDWWYGSLNGRKGIFPANYVELV